MTDPESQSGYRSSIPLRNLESLKLTALAEIPNDMDLLGLLTSSIRPISGQLQENSISR